MKVLVLRSENIKIGSYVDLLEDAGQSQPVAILAAMGAYMVTWVQHICFASSEMMLAKVELAD